MPSTLVIVGVCLLFVGAAFLRAASASVRRGRWAGGGVRALLGLLLLALAALAATITIGVHGYRALTLEVLAASVKTEPVGPQRFRATIVLPDRRLAMYELAGDAFYVDAHILKWHPAANLLGLHTAYELDRVGGRYNAIADERTKPHTMYTLARARRLDLFSLVRRFPLFRPLVDAEYGSAAFVAATRPVEYEVRVSTTGLLMRPALR
ncbi:MAG: hypothetical protein DMD36_01580 [Gemmatimonadetes bacterium]|nr:MAG: hypothetical protein DMD36_01580 [Gemmatimonadota bacterium]